MSADYFAGRLRELRDAKGWSQEHLAQQAGLTRDGVAHLEQGRRKPGWETVLALAAALAVSTEAFRQAPASRDQPSRGRPRKAPVKQPEKPKGEEQPQKKQRRKGK